MEITAMADTFHGLYFFIAYNGPNPAIDVIFHPKILFFAIFSTYQVQLISTTHRIIVGWLIIT